VKSDLSEFPIEKTTAKFRYAAMRRALLHFFHRPALRFGPMGSRGPCRNARFVSFLAESNRRPLDTDFHDVVLRGRKLFRKVLVVGIILGGAWVALESAHALTVF
jgi:hypothetical protein